MMKQIKLSFFLLLLNLALSAQFDSESSIKYENYGILSETFLNSGYCYEIEVIDNIMYVGSDAGFQIYDISNIEEYELVGHYSCKSVRSFYIEDDNVYLATIDISNSWRAKVEIIDISDISNPNQIFSHDLGYVIGPGWGITVRDDFIYVSYFYLFLIDIDNLSNPVVYKINTIHPYDFVVNDTLLYVTAVGNYFDIYDIVNDTSFIFKSSVNCQGSNLQVNGDFAYISGGSLKIVNVSDPNNPEVLSETMFINNVAVDVNVVQTKAYVIGSNNDDGVFAIVDVLNPLDPTISFESTEFLGRHITVNNNKAVISTRTNNGIGASGLKTLDVEDPNNVSLLNFTISSTATKCRVYDNVVYIANGYAGFKIIDISNFLNPNTITETSTKWKTVDVFKDSNILYVAEADSGIQIFNIVNPEQPEYLSSHCSPYAWDGYLKLDKYQNYLYTGGACGINDIIDVSDPQNPVYMGTVPVYDWGYDIQIMDDHLFVAGYWGGFQIFSLADPVNPVMVGHYPLGLALKIAVSKDLGYIYDNDAILIFDISDYTNPSLISIYSTGVYHMYAQGDTLYFSDGLSRINVLDVSNPYIPVIVDSITDTRALSFDFSNNSFITHDEYILKIIGDTTIVSTDNKLELREEYYLHQNIPNPCSENTSITISLPETMNIKLELYDNIGRKLNTLIDRRLNKGEHTIMYNTASLKQGIYYYRLIINDKYAESKKMLVIRN